MAKSTSEILEELDDYVFGHLEAKKAIITMLNRSGLRFIQKYYKGMAEEHLITPMKLLLIAASGTGKTHLVESLQKVAHFPLVRIDATQLLPSGASTGGINLSKLKSLLAEEASKYADLYPEYYLSPQGALDRSVVFVDEIDKLGMSFESSGNWNKHVQSNFLTLFDNKDEFSGVSFVFAGAFHDITKKKEKKHSIGFNKTTDSSEDAPLDEQVLRSGLIPEIVGRFNYIVRLDVFSETELYKILTQILIPKKMKDLAAYHIFDAEVDELELADLVKEAAKSEQGVRYMQRWLDKKFLEDEFNANMEHVFKLEY
jgi:ATP-dependent Clp protease ATP-binding subunit ClpX